MLTEFLYQWNPFNIYGSKVGLEDLISHPLQPNETLMQDDYGYFRRICVPPFHSSRWKQTVFWLQTHLNKKGHLEAIDKLIALFYQNILQNPPQKTENLQEVVSQIHQLRSLKNDYGFTHSKLENPSFVDERLKVIEEHAYSIFTYYYQQQVAEQEEVRKQAFFLFKVQMDIELRNLALENFTGLIKNHLLMIIPSEMLPVLFEECAQNLDERLKLIQDLYQQINEMESMHQGKFTIPFIDDHLTRMRLSLSNEVAKIALEVELLIRNLILHYRLIPFKTEAKVLLDSMQVDPDATRSSTTYSFQYTFEDEIQRIRCRLKERFKKE